MTIAAIPATAQTATAASAPAVGQKAPDFELATTGGEKFKLSEALADGPVVVVMLRGYPGYQCPLCSRQVAGLVKQARVLDAKVSRVVFVYPGEPSMLQQHAVEFAAPTSLPKPFVMVTDPGYKMVDAWGLRWNAPRETAYPSTFVIGTDGMVKWQKVSAGHGDRSNPADVIAAL